MDYFLSIALPIIAIALIVGGVVFLHKKSNSYGNNAISTEQTNSINSAVLVTAGGVQGGEITIPIELLSATTQIEEKSLFEITDRTVIARISQTLPAVAETATRTKLETMTKSIDEICDFQDREVKSRMRMNNVFARC